MNSPQQFVASPQKPRLPRSSTAGFALVIALMMMGLVLLLILSLSSLVQLNLQGSTHDRKRQLAEQNALMGLRVAVGQLQQMMGPDQRISTRADIEQSDAPGSSFAHPYWTGVWEEQSILDEDGNDTGQTQAVRLAYLVSGNEPSAMLDAKDANLSPEESVTLVKSFTDASGVTRDAVVAKKAPIREGTESKGAYAYWISDEGIKAKANLQNVSSTPADSVNFNLMTPQQFGIEQMDGLEEFPAQAGNLGALTSLSTLDQLGDFEAKNHIHDLTLHSYGILSDTKHGGLREDLTLGLAETSTLPAGQIFDPIPGAWSPDENPGGPLWSQLRSWANTTLGSSAGARGALPVRRATDDTAGYAPVIAGWELTTLPTYDATKQVYLHFMPVVVLWNPYDVPLETATYKVRFIYATMDESTAAKYSYRPDKSVINSRRILKFDIQIRDGSETVPHPQNEKHYNLSGKVTISEVELELPNVTLQPGQSKTYSLQQNIDLTGTKAADSLDYDYNPESTLTLEESLPGGFFYRLPLLIDNDIDNDSNPLAFLTEHTDTGTTELLTAYRTAGITMPRGISLELLRAGGTPSGDEILSANYYLKHAQPNTALPYANLALYNYQDNAPLTDAQRNQSWGYKASRTWTQLPDRGTTYPQTSQLRWTGDFNPRAFSSGPLPFNFVDNAGLIDRYPAHNPSYFSATEYNNDNFGEELEGTGYSSEFVVDNTILFEAPYGVNQLYSIGQLTQAPLYYFNDNGAAPDETNRNGTRDFFYGRNRYTRFDNLIPAYAIGNSRAHVAIPTGQTYRDWAALSFTEYNNSLYFSFKGLLYDYSYLLNEALWDRYFFSSLEEQPSAGGTPTYVPRNPRIVSVNGSIETIPGLDESAEELLIDGAFNINSTSEAAWRALLSSFLEEPVLLSEGSTEATATGETPFPRLTAPSNNALPSGLGNAVTNPLAYNGYRTLTKSQINQLAEEIVRQVKLRGPFTSLSEFVNRALLSSDAENRHLRGALDAAIQEAGINNALTTGTQSTIRNRPAAVPADNWYGSEAGEGYTTENIPGWFSQAELLSRLGSVLAARSDTFLIRAYGEYRDPLSNPSGAPTSYAVCEAIVQRLPSYVDSGDIQRPNTPYNDLNPTNQELGRGFALVSFRWLTEGDL